MSARSPAEPSRIAIVKLGALGDLVHTLPAFQLLRRRFPAAAISWIVHPPGAALLANVTGLDEVLAVDRRRPGELARFIGRHHGRFDCLLDFQGLYKSAALSRLLGGENIGFARENLRERLAGAFYRRQAAPLAEGRHVVWKNVHLLHTLGIAPAPFTSSLLPPSPPPPLREFLERLGGAAASLTLLNVGGGWPTKVLAPAVWIDLVHELAPETSLALLWGTPPEERRAREIAAATGVPVVPFLDFRGLISLLAGVRTLVSADSLPLHLADALGTPTVGYFGPTSPRRNGPLDPRSQVVGGSSACGFCYLRRCATMTCMKTITATRLAVAIRRVHASAR